MSKKLRSAGSGSKTTIFPPGCPGLFPREICTNPTIRLNPIGTISCDGTISGKVRCDLRPLPNVTVNLSSSFTGLTFSDPSPVTDQRGEFSTTVIVDLNTKPIPNVSFTAEAVIIDKQISDTVTARVECVNCPDPVITPSSSQLSASQLPKAECPGTPISGRVTCEGLPAPNVEVYFEVESASGKVIVTPNPAVTDQNGVYEATILPFAGALEIATIVAVAQIGGNEVKAPPEQYEVICPGCENLEIMLNDPGQISCSGTLSGRLTCDGSPVATIPVTISASPVLNIIGPPPVTDANGEFSTVVTVNFGTEPQEASFTAEATYNDKTATASGTVTVDCLRCQTPVLTLNTPAGTVGCAGGELTGRFTCNGEPLSGIPVFFTVLSSGNVTVNPNPAFTNSEGVYTATLQPGLNVTETVTVIASAMIGGEEVRPPSRNVSVNCRCTRPVIELDNPGPISCRTIITGRLLCEGLPVPNTVVTLSSPLLQFQTPNPVTGPNGEFSSVATVQPITPVQEGVPFTAEATVNGIRAENTNFVRAECLFCESQSLTLNPPAGVVGCGGAPITGRVLCGNSPARNVAVFFTIDPLQPNPPAFISPNPAITDSNGNYEASITPVQGASGTIEVTAFTTLGGRGISAGPFAVQINCPFPPQECSCRFRLNTSGSVQPDANIRVVRFGQAQDYTGTLNINVVQCGSGIEGICNPAVDNFNFEFNAKNGDNFQFTQGRRTSISCGGNFTIATVEGTIRGRINNGPFRTFDAKITATLNAATDFITWEIFATDNTTTTFQTLTPFTAQGSPTSFIVGCPS